MFHWEPGRQDQALLEQFMESRRLDPDYNSRQTRTRESAQLDQADLRASVEIQGGYQREATATNG